jgi:tetratricopeptide (TPR) repeat protein
LNDSANKASKESNYDRAESLYTDAIRTAQLFRCDPSFVAQSALNLADVYKYEAKYQESEQLFLQVKAQIPTIQKEYRGLEATRLNNLADLYLQLARYDEAARLAIESIGIRKAEFGTKHPAYAVSVATLGEAYLGQTRISEAEPLFREALAITSKKGSEWARAGSESRLAQILTARGDNVEAEKMAVRAVTDQEQASGTRHPQVAEALVVLATVYRASGKFTEARSACERARTIDEAVFKSNHPQIATVLHELAEIYMAQKMYSDAEPLLRRALQIRRNLLPPDHPDYQQTRADYQELLQRISGETKISPQN